MGAMRQVLIADDEARIRDVVQYALEQDGFTVTAVSDGRAALEKAEQLEFDLIVLDVMMPEMDGFEVCRKLRAQKNTPILFLSARGEEFDRVLGLELGADDYLSKPFSPRELVARVKAILRRSDDTQRSGTERALVIGALTIDRERHEVRVGGNLVPLTATEFGLLYSLYQRPGIVLSRAQLMERAYAFDNHVTERTIDTHVRRIRSKFRKLDAEDPIGTVHGVGYKANVS